MMTVCRRGHDLIAQPRAKNGECIPCKAATNREWYLANRERTRDCGRRWVIDNPDKRRELHWAKVGITDADGGRFTVAAYNRLFEMQSGRCAICGTESDALVRPLVVDHDHSTGRVRGLLCDEDNKGLGSFQDSAARLLNAARYLETIHK